MFDELTSGRQSSVPLGWSMSVPAPYRSEPLCYFTPNSFSELLARVPRPRSTSLTDQIQPRLEASLLTGVLHANNGQANGKHLAVYGDLMFGRYSLDSLADLCVLAATLTGHSKLALRQDIAYAGHPGARNPKIFALQDHIHELMASLVKSLAQADVDACPRDVALLTLFFVLFVHPFMDGNGRLSRCLALYAAARAGNVAEGALVAAVQASNRGWFFDIGQRAKEEGSSLLTNETYQAVGEVRAQLQAVHLNLTVTKLTGIVESELERRQLLLRYISSCIAIGSMHKDETKRVLGCSENKAIGLVSKVASAIPDSSLHQDMVSFQPYLATLKANMGIR